jgi:Mor family transcriptional regulator
MTASSSLDQFPDHYPEILSELKAILADSLTAAGIDAAKSSQCAHVAAEKIRKIWGGQMVYIAKGKDYELSQRDLEIWEKFTGRNHSQLCREYGISLQWLYKIINHQRAADVKRRQNDIFG